MRHYGLIGRKLGHSWSAEYFARKFAEERIDADYRLIELPELTAETVAALNEGLDGYNVTIPYKEAILPYLQDLHPIAAETGAVNVVKDGRGYNTDWAGCAAALRECPSFSEREVTKALILGRGGAAKAVKYALKTMGIASEMISARGKVDADLQAYGLIVNATPLGMTPDVQSFPDIDYAALTPKHILFDCVYNPAETMFLRRGKEQGATAINGLTMLVEQAKESWKIWNQNI